MVKKIFLWILFLIFLYLFSPQSSFAVFSFNIASISATTISSGGQEIDVNLNIIDLPLNESYFRVALQKGSGGSYFGYVKNNNGDWAAIQPLSGDCTIYYKVSDPSTTSLALKFKVGDDATIDNGNYTLKAHRFSATCKTYKEATTSASFTVSLPTPIQSPTSSPSPTPTPTPTKTPTPTPTPIPTKILVGFEEEIASESEILGTSSAQPSASLETAKPEVKTLGESEKIMQRVFIILGFLTIITSAGILIKQKWIK